MHSRRRARIQVKTIATGPMTIILVQNHCFSLYFFLYAFDFGSFGGSTSEVKCWGGRRAGSGYFGVASVLGLVVRLVLREFCAAMEAAGFEGPSVFAEVADEVGCAAEDGLAVFGSLPGGGLGTGPAASFDDVAATPSFRGGVQVGFDGKEVGEAAADLGGVPGLGAPFLEPVVLAAFLATSVSASIPAAAPFLCLGAFLGFVSFGGAAFSSAFFFLVLVLTAFFAVFSTAEASLATLEFLMATVAELELCAAPINDAGGTGEATATTARRAIANAWRPAGKRAGDMAVGGKASSPRGGKKKK